MKPLCRSDIFDKLHDWRPDANMHWLTADALSVGKHIDGAGVYHPSFVLNFRLRSDDDGEFSDLHFGTSFRFSRPPSLEWVNNQNNLIRFSKLSLVENVLQVTCDLFGPSHCLAMLTFESTFVLYDHCLVIIKAMEDESHE